MNISIIFAIHNGLQYTKNSLLNLTSMIENPREFVKFNIIIIDDGSKDKSRNWIKENYPEIHILEGDGNLWWSKSMNLGLEYAFEELESDYSLCWNNDIFSEIEYIENLINEINKLGKNEFLCSKILYKEENDTKIKIFSCGCFFNRKKGAIKIRNNKKYEDETYDKEDYVDWCGGMGMLITKKLYCDNGYFDSKAFPQYKADADYCLRAQDKGFKLKYSPKLKIYNDPNNSGINNKNGDIFLTLSLLYSKRSIYNLWLNYKFFNKYCSTTGLILGMLQTYGRYLKLLIQALRYK